jgi:hypothetical protein
MVATAMRTATEARVHCPLCGGAGRHAFHASDRNREASAERFAYARCEVCGTVFIVDAPADLGRYYEGDYYAFGPDGEPGWKTNGVRMASASYRVALLLEHAAPGHLIEIGAGTGAFASAARAAGFDVSAIEMDGRCCRYLSEQEGITAICSDRPLEALASLAPARAIALWHVLEHLSNPAELLERIADKLEPEGVLAIGVPNPRSLQFRLMGNRWPHLDAPRHLCLIPPDALIARGEQLGMRTIAKTTNDPEGLEFNLFGWVNALRRRPARGTPSWLAGHAALTMGRALAPLERTGSRGSTITLVMRKEPGPR